MDNDVLRREGAVDLTVTAPTSDGRFDSWREAFGRTFLRLDLEPQGDLFTTRMSLRALPNLGLGAVTTSGCRVMRTRELLADGQDDIGMVALLQGHGRARDSEGREVELGPGEAIFLRNGGQGFVEYADDSAYLCFTIPEQIFATFIADRDAACMRTIRSGSGPLDLLTRYTQLVVADEALTRDAGPAIARHIHDLAAMIMAGTPELAAALDSRGARTAARLATIKAEIRSRISDSTLSITGVAGKFGITPRYVARLFEHEGTSFTAFVLEQRLSLARNLLEDPSRAGLSISALALASGFGDISYFNKCFRRRYGMTPSEIRRTTGNRSET